MRPFAHATRGIGAETDGGALALPGCVAFSDRPVVTGWVAPPGMVTLTGMVALPGRVAFSSRTALSDCEETVCRRSLREPAPL